MRQNWPETIVARPPWPKPGQCRARCGRRGRRARDRHRPARRRRALVRARARAGRGGRALVRRFAAGRAARVHPVVALCPRAPDRRDHLQAGRAVRRRGADHRRRAPARARVRDLRPPDDGRHPPQIPRGSRAPPPPRQILPPPAGRRELGRRDPAPAVDAQHHQPPLLRPARAGRVPPGRRAVLPLHPRGARRGGDPRHRPQGASSSIAASRLTISSRTPRAIACPRCACGITARRSRPKARPRPPRRTRWREAGEARPGGACSASAAAGRRRRQGNQGAAAGDCRKPPGARRGVADGHRGDARGRRQASHRNRCQHRHRNRHRHARGDGGRRCPRKAMARWPSARPRRLGSKRQRSTR